jgi:hypothetical protein
MAKIDRLRHEFVQLLPDQLDEGVLYVSLDYATAAHKCCCGCGREVITPLSPVDWEITYDGETISLSPSIGNWNFPCQSHYWIKRGNVKWARRWTREEIDAGRTRDGKAQSRRFAEPEPANGLAEVAATSQSTEKSPWRTLLSRFRGRRRPE